MSRRLGYNRFRWHSLLKITLPLTNHEHEKKDLSKGIVFIQE